MRKPEPRTARPRTPINHPLASLESLASIACLEMLSDSRLEDMLAGGIRDKAALAELVRRGL